MSGLPNYKVVHIPLRSSFDWYYLKENSVEYHDKALADYVMFGFSLGLKSDHVIISNAKDNHSSAREYHQAVTDYIHSGLFPIYQDSEKTHFGELLVYSILVVSK